MLRSSRWFRFLAVLASVTLAVCVTTTSAFAIDRVTLTDGTVVEGEIYKELDGYVWITVQVGGVAQKKSFSPDQISKIEKGASAPGVSPAPSTGDKPAATTAKPAADATTPAVTPIVPPVAAKTGTKGAPKALVLTLGDRYEHKDMVGVYLVAHILKSAIPTLEKELGTDRTGVLVLRVSSGGGAGAEVFPVNEVIQNEFKPRFRTVAWIDSAISAAAMSTLVCDEIYFTTRGNFGACTGFYGSLDRPVEGIELEKSLHEMEIASSRGGYNPIIMRAMQIQQPLSADIDEFGTVKYYPDASSGKIVVNENRRILTFNSELALKVKFSRGTADTLEELTKLMGYQELEWVGDEVKGIQWPVSRSERMQIAFRDKAHQDEARLNEYYTKFQANFEQARRVPKDQRPKFVGPALDALEKIKSMVRNNPNFSWMTFNRPGKEFWDWIGEIEKNVRDLLR